MATFQAKTVYHSHLLRAGRTMMKIKGEVRDSNFEGKMPYVYFVCPDDDTEYCWQVEPPTRASVEAAPVGEWLYVTAYGGKDEEKSIIIEDSAGPVLDGKREDTAQHRTIDAVGERMKIEIIDALEPNWKEATELVYSHPDSVEVAPEDRLRATVDVFTTIWATRFIQANRR